VGRGLDRIRVKSTYLLWNQRIGIFRGCLDCLRLMNDDGLDSACFD